MYTIITWDRQEPGKPCITHEKNRHALYRLLYNAGQNDKDIILQEYDYDDVQGETLDTLFDSTTL